MPWTSKQDKLFRAVAHGWKPSDPSIKLSPAKASELLEHSKTKKQRDALSKEA